MGGLEHGLARRHLHRDRRDGQFGLDIFQAVVFPAPQGRFDAIALALLALALWLLLRRNWGVVRTLLLSAALGVLVLNNGVI